MAAVSDRVEKILELYERSYAGQRSRPDAATEAKAGLVNERNGQLKRRCAELEAQLAEVRRRFHYLLEKQS